MPKIKKKRISFVLDMTPLVDITFLLLTFFMFTTKFKNDAENEQKFTIARPQASADTSKLPDKDLALVKVALDTTSSPPDTNYYYAILNEIDRQTVMSAMTNLPDSMKAKPQLMVDLQTLDLLVRQTRAANYKTRFAIDADRRIRYKWIDDVMEVFRKNRATLFNFVTEKRQ